MILVSAQSFWDCLDATPRGIACVFRFMAVELDRNQEEVACEQVEPTVQDMEHSMPVEEKEAACEQVEPTVQDIEHSMPVEEKEAACEQVEPIVEDMEDAMPVEEKEAACEQVEPTVEDMEYAMAVEEQVEPTALDMEDAANMDWTPGKASECSGWSDTELGVRLAALPPAEKSNTVEQERSLLPICGLPSHEQGIRLLRRCLAQGRKDPQWELSQTDSCSPLWGGMDDWKVLRPHLAACLQPASASLPEDIVAVPAAYFRDAEFQAPNPTEDCVLVSGGIENAIREGATGGCHFMPMLSLAAAKECPASSAPVSKWKDMVAAVEGRCGEAVLVDWVRDAGDCYFHSLLIALHFKGVLMHVCQNSESVPSPVPPTLTTPPPSQPRANSTQGSPDTTQSPALVGRRGLCFEDSLADETAAGYMTPDPLEASLARLRAVNGTEEFEDVVFPDRIFEDMRNKDAVYEMVKRNIGIAWSDPRTHRQMAAEDEMDIRLCAASPIAEAIHTLARAKGVQPEALLACVEANIGFLEVPGTVLCHNPRMMHFISPGSPVIVGSPSSTRKSALIKLTDGWLCDAPGAPEEFKERSVLTTDSTTKGVRNCLKEYGRCAVTSDEAANTFETKQSDREMGIHFVSITKLNTWTQSEYDGPTTGNGSFSLSDYQFMLKTAGQLAVAEQVVQPRVHGFQKRLKQVWVMREINTQDQQLFQASDELMCGWHSWMHQTVGSQGPVTISLSGRALTMYNAAKQAVEDFISEHALPSVFKTKLMFFHSDVLRDAHKVYRSSQFLETFVPGRTSSQIVSRVHISLDEFTVGLHKWMVQLRTHFASYRFSEKKREEASAACGGKSTDVKAAAAELCAVPEEEPEPLPSDALFMRVLMSKTPCNTWFTTADARLWLKNKRGSSFKNDLSPKIDKAIDHLVEKGLMETFNEEGLRADAKFTERASKRRPDQGKAKSGRAGKIARKRTFQEVQDDESAQAEQRRLRLSANDFDI